METLYGNNFYYTTYSGDTNGYWRVYVSYEGSSATVGISINPNEYTMWYNVKGYINGTEVSALARNGVTTSTTELGTVTLNRNIENTISLTVSGKTGNPNGNGTSSVTIPANNYTVTLTAGTGISDVHGAGTYTSGDIATIDATVSTGYTWSKWSDDVTTKRRTITVDRDYNLTASAILNSYSVTLGKGTGISSATGGGSKQYGSSVTITATASSGYNFTSWKQQQSDGSYADLSTSNPYTFTMPAYNVTNKAFAVPIEYTISYNLNGGTVSTANPTNYTIEFNEITLNNPTKNGYTFKGWTGSNGTTPQETVRIAKGSTGDKSYTANWGANEYTYNVVFRSSTGVSLGSTTVTHAFDTTNTITAPAKTGYSTPPNQSVKWDSTSAKTITFIYTPIRYKITYNENDGSTVSDQNYTIEDNITLGASSKTGYTFNKWNLPAKSGNWNAGDYSANQSISKGKYGNITLNATWAPNVYTITLNKNNGSGGTSTYYLKYNTGKYSNSNCTAAITKITCPTRTGYAFNGYYTDTNYTTQVIDKDGNITHINTAFSTDRELHAQWVENKLTVHYYSNKATKFIGESNLFTGTLSKDENIKIHSQEYPYESLPSGYTTISLRDYTHAGSLGMEKTGYAPTGYWNTKVDGSGTSIDQITEYANGQKIAEALGLDLFEGNAEVDVYAQWELEYDAFIRIKDGNTEKWAYAEAYCFDGGKWKKADVYIHDGTKFERPVFKDL